MDTNKKPVFQIEIKEPYPKLNGGQNIGRARGPAHRNRYIYRLKVVFSKIKNICDSVDVSRYGHTGLTQKNFL